MPTIPTIPAPGIPPAKAGDPYRRQLAESRSFLEWFRAPTVKQERFRKYLLDLLLVLSGVQFFLGAGGRPARAQCVMILEAGVAYLEDEYMREEYP